MKKKEKSDFETDIEALYNIDGNGSRVVPIIYGFKQVILVTEINRKEYRTRIKPLHFIRKYKGFILY
ncbi:hypothetical protein RSJ2_667 [Clostridium botulinum]|nr:hypothetical protein RSJ2_667 [Clostridium botulinum]OSA83161.1 hypothetical protein B2H84_05060 [Clostridium botulinum]BDB00547.1 hypothetical protein CBOS2020_06210 [Clostridium botulinum]